MNKETVKTFMGDLETAITIDFFEMREEELREMGAELPKNIEDLRQEAVYRNITKLEADISSASHPNYRATRQQKLDEIKRRYAPLLKC